MIMTAEQFEARLETFIKDYRDDDEQPLPQVVAVAAMTALKTAWGTGPYDFTKMGNEVARLIQILNAFHGQVAIGDWAVNGPPKDDDDD